MTNPTATPGQFDDSDPPELAEFKNVHQDDDGMWHAVHESGFRISAASWPEMEMQAVVVRVLASWHRTWGTGRSV